MQKEKKLLEERVKDASVSVTEPMKEVAQLFMGTVFLEEAFQPLKKRLVIYLPTLFYFLHDLTQSFQILGDRHRRSEEKWRQNGVRGRKRTPRSLGCPHL